MGAKDSDYRGKVKIRSVGNIMTRDEAAVGQIWQDRDKRMNGRRCRIVAIADGKAHMENVGDMMPKVTRVRLATLGTRWRLVK